jgi:hypothetical protein
LFLAVDLDSERDQVVLAVTYSSPQMGRLAELAATESLIRAELEYQAWALLAALETQAELRASLRVAVELARLVKIKVQAEQVGQV